MQSHDRFDTFILTIICSLIFVDFYCIVDSYDLVQKLKARNKWNPYPTVCLARVYL